jgi:hypothetical protein
MTTYNGTDEFDLILGSLGKDQIKAKDGDDYVDGAGGDDKIDGGDGNDTLIGGLGNDRLKGGEGDDVLDGGEGDDKLDGGDGNDTLIGGLGDDKLKGGKGDDLLNGGDGDDELKGGKGADTLNGGDGNDEIDAGSDDDVIIGGDGDDTIDGGDGNDTAVFSGSITDFTISTNDGVTTVFGNGTQGTDTLENVETLVFDDYTIDLTAENNGPAAFDDTFSGDEDTRITGNVLDNNGNGADFDFEGDTLTVQTATITTANGGTVVLLADGSFTYDPADNYNGPDSFTYTVTDGLLSDSAVVNIIVDAINDAPVAIDDVFAGDEDMPISGNVLADNGLGADNDADGDSLSVVAAVITTANGGTVNLLTDGSFTYEPVDDYNGPDSFSYTVTDGVLTDTATANITLDAVNDAPVASDDSFSGDEDTLITGNVLTDNGNGADFDLEGDTLSVFAEVITTANGGTVTLLAGGSFTYQPADNYNGPDRFTYTLSDGDLTDTGTANITVNAVNDGPVAADDTFAGDEDTPISGNVLADNGLGVDTDIDGDSLSVVAEVITTANGGTVTLLSDGSFTYDPAENYSGPDGFSYIVTDGVLTDTGAINIIVNAVNDAAVANDDAANTAVDSEVEINAFSNDTDAENDMLTITEFTQPENGSVVETSPGLFTYTPNEGFTGSDAFSYTITDGFGETSTADVNITVGEPSDENTAPDALSANVEATIEDGVANVFTIDFNTMTVNGELIISDSEQSIAELDITTLFIQNGERLGVEFVETSLGSNIFTLDLNGLNIEDGSFRDLNITYTVDDGQGENSMSTGQINLTVNNPDDGPTNTAPDAGDATITQTEADGMITVNLAAALGLATDAEGDALTVTSLVFVDEFGNELEFDPLEASGTELSGGIVMFDPNVFGLGDGVTGSFQLLYTVSDGSASDSGVVTLNLTGSAENTAPTTVNSGETRTLPDDITLGSNNIEFDLNALVNDVDQDNLAIALVSITDSLGITIPVTVVGNDVIGADGVITGMIIDGVVTINVTELELEAGESLDFVINYTVSDGINPPVMGELDVTVDGPEEVTTGTVIEDFESYSSEEGSTITLTDIGGLTFDGTATAIEVDELGGRAAEGMIAGETTVDATESVPDGNAAVIEGTYIGDDDLRMPEYAFTAFAPGATASLDSGPIFTPVPETTFGTAFDLESISLTALSGPMTTVSIVTYRIEEVSPFSFQYVAVGEFEVSISATEANMLDFTSGQFADAFIFDDASTTEIETSAFENIVAFQIVTTGSLFEINPNDPENSELVPQFDDPLVIDDLVFVF